MSTDNTSPQTRYNDIALQNRRACDAEKNILKMDCGICSGHAILILKLLSFKGILSNIVKEHGHLDILCNNAGVESGSVQVVVSINLVSENS